MRVRRLETVVQYVSDPAASARWYARLLGIEPTPYVAPYFRFDEHAYLILASAAPGTGHGGSGVWFEVESVAEAYRELVAAGFDFNEEPYPGSTEPATRFGCRDTQTGAPLKLG